MKRRRKRKSQLIEIQWRTQKDNQIVRAANYQIRWLKILLILSAASSLAIAWPNVGQVPHTKAGLGSDQAGENSTKLPFATPASGSPQDETVAGKKDIKVSANTGENVTWIASSQGLDKISDGYEDSKGLDDTAVADGDLIAVESTRLLTIGRRPPYAASSAAANGSQMTNGQLPVFVAMDSHHPGQISSQARPPQFVRLVPSPGLKLTPGLAPSQVRLVPAWPPLYYLKPLNNSIPPTADVPIVDSKAATRTEPIANEYPNYQASAPARVSEVEYLDDSWRNKVHESSHIETTRKTTKASNNETNWLTKSINNMNEFPNLAANNSEDQFERGLSRGNYQRTNASRSSWAQLLKQANEGNVMESLMVTNRTMVSLLCNTNDMLVRLRFKYPFRGRVSTNLDPIDSCHVDGTGGRYYELRVSLRACGTRQEMPRLFINNIKIAFQHGQQQRQRQLDLGELEDIELKTIICSYPIRPWAPPPPDLDTGGLPERIIEQPKSDEPAKLVHYEPIVLISGLLLLALTLLGFTVGSYLVTRQLGARRSSTSNGSQFSSARIYRNSPAQVANLPPALLAPPVIGMARTKRYGTRASPINRNKSGPQKSHDTKESRHIGGRLATAPKSAQINMNPSDESSDSLAEKGDKSPSVTTIEIPYNNKTPFPVYQDSKTTKASKLDVGETDNVSPQSKETPNATTENKDKENPKGPILTSSESIIHTDVLTRKVNRKTITKKAGPDDKTVGISREDKSKELPRFGSLRATLTSPREFKRLQEISRLFDEVLVESSNQASDRKSLVQPSKYQQKIQNQLSEQQRILLKETLTNDEIFRSLIIESTNKEIFYRKLRNNRIYANKFKQETWNLLEEIIMDPEPSKMESGTDFGPDSKIFNNSDKRIVVQRFDSEILNRNQNVQAQRDDSLDSNKEQDLSMPDRQLIEQLQQFDLSKNNGSCSNMVRISQYNSTCLSPKSGLLGTKISVDSMTNFSNSEDFSTYTRSRIKHTRYEAQEDSLPYVDDKVVSYDYTDETPKQAWVNKSKYNSNININSNNNNNNTKP